MVRESTYKRGIYILRFNSSRVEYHRHSNAMKIQKILFSSSDEYIDFLQNSYKVVLNMEFSLNIKIDQTHQKTLIWTGESYYRENHADQISICDNHILIKGSRSKLSSLSMTLFNTSSSLYRQILKTLSFYYWDRAWS